MAGLLAALSFLSRLGPARSRLSLGAALPWLGCAGLIIGLFCACGAWLLWFIAAETGAGADLAALCAGFAWLALEIILSNGLHWDGAADLGDALGSGAAGEKFWLVLKDSRLGAWGALTILLLFCCQWLCAALHASSLAQGCLVRALAPLVLAIAWSRLSSVWLAFGRSAPPQSSLGLLLVRETDAPVFLLSLGQGIACLAALWLLGLSFWRLLLLCAAQAAFLAWILNRANRHGGLSGDFFGAAIEGSQTIFLLFSLMGNTD